MRGVIKFMPIESSLDSVNSGILKKDPKVFDILCAPFADLFSNKRVVQIYIKVASL